MDLIWLVDEEPCMGIPTQTIAVCDGAGYSVGVGMAEIDGDWLVNVTCHALGVLSAIRCYEFRTRDEAAAHAAKVLTKAAEIAALSPRDVIARATGAN